MHKFKLYADKAATQLLETVTFKTPFEAAQYAYRKYGGNCKNIKQVS